MKVFITLYREIDVIVPKIDDNFVIRDVIFYYRSRSILTSRTGKITDSKRVKPYSECSRLYPSNICTHDRITYQGSNEIQLRPEADPFARLCSSANKLFWSFFPRTSGGFQKIHPTDKVDPLAGHSNLLLGDLVNLQRVLIILVLTPSREPEAVGEQNFRMNLFVPLGLSANRNVKSVFTRLNFELVCPIAGSAGRACIRRSAD
ncbi:hypothetical protein ACFE04_021494 [Oxalis oulophora]